MNDILMDMLGENLPLEVISRICHKTVDEIKETVFSNKILYLPTRYQAVNNPWTTKRYVFAHNDDAEWHRDFSLEKAARDFREIFYEKCSEEEVDKRHEHIKKLAELNIPLKVIADIVNLPAYYVEFFIREFDLLYHPILVREEKKD